MLNVNPDVLWYDLEGELVLLNIATGRYHGLDAIGGVIFRALAAHQSMPELVTSLTERYDVGADVARAEVERLIGELRAAKLVSDEDTAAGAR
jgi:Coenzyme PQQ synthesis protein D (PqqD)